MKIPDKIINIAEVLSKAGFEVYLVGGCVRDLLIGKTPKDWDITTNAKPEEIQDLFPDSVYENTFGTVGVKVRKNDEVEVVEITPYRLESKYSDKRHPDKVSFTRNIEEDLKRRDFTINAMAMNVSGEIKDLFGGQEDLKNQIIRAVGNAEERFDEDALRILRAVRFAVQLGFEIEDKTQQALKKQANLLKNIAKERIKDEFIKVIMSDILSDKKEDVKSLKHGPARGVELMRELGILKYVAPELEDGYSVGQNKSHIYDIWEHNLYSLNHAAFRKWPLEVRLAALFHDIGKPKSKRRHPNGKDWTFYGHEVVGARMTAKILSNLKFPVKTIDLVSKFVRYHMFFSDTEEITLSAVRRIVRNIGAEHIWNLVHVRFCDRIGMGKPKEEPYRLRKYESMIEEAMRAPLSVTALKIDGVKVMDLLHVKPGPVIGNLLHVIFEEVLEDPDKNNEEWLEKRVLELGKLSETELKKLGDKAKTVKESAEDAEIKEIRKKYWVE